MIVYGVDPRKDESKDLFCDNCLMVNGAYCMKADKMLDLDSQGRIMENYRLYKCPAVVMSDFRGNGKVDIIFDDDSEKDEGKLGSS